MALAAEGEVVEAETVSARCTDDTTEHCGCAGCAGALWREGTCCHIPGLTGDAGEGILRGTGGLGMEILPGAWVATEAIWLTGINPLSRETCGHPGRASVVVPEGNTTVVKTCGSSGATKVTAG